MQLFYSRLSSSRAGEKDRDGASDWIASPQRHKKVVLFTSESTVFDHPKEAVFDVRNSMLR